MSTHFAHLCVATTSSCSVPEWLAERYFPEDPTTALLKLRQLGERLAQQVASRFGVAKPIEETQLMLLRRLEADGLLEREVAELIHVLRRKGTLASHDLHGDQAPALRTLRIAWQLGVWFHRTLSEPDFRSCQTGSHRCGRGAAPGPALLP